MASSTAFYTLLLLLGVSSCFRKDLFAEGSDRFPSNSEVGGHGSSFFFYAKLEYPRDCNEVRDACSSSVSSGVYLIKPEGYEEPFEAYCDNEFDSGGWTVILRRFDGSVGFNRNWSDCKRGFGYLSTEFWLGNDKLSYITNQEQYELQIDLTLDNGTSFDTKYSVFRIGDEWGDYTIATAEVYQSNEGGDNRTLMNSSISTSFNDCNDAYNAGNTHDGVYRIRPTGWNGSPFDVFCNMTIDGGSWTVIQRRVDGSTDFYQNWTSYKEGFGNLQHEFWLGNEKIYHLTNQSTYEYRFDYRHGSGWYYHKYDRFRIDDESNKYKITEVGSRTGNRGHTLGYTRNIGFSTYDQDNDGWDLYDCAEGHRGGWWYGGEHFENSFGTCFEFRSGNQSVRCSHSNVNGLYRGGGRGQNLFQKGHSCYVIYAEMKVRRTL